MVINPLYFLSFIFSTVLAFFTTALLVHCSIYLLKIKNYRTRFILRLLPFVTPFIDFLALEFSISNWLNPLSCSSCAQKIILSFFFPELQEHLYDNQISLMDYYYYDSIGMIALALVGCIFTYFIIRTFFQLFIANQQLCSIIKNSTPYRRILTNPNLQASIDSRQTQILLSNEIRVPLATPYNTIILPFEIDQFLQMEFETVVAHEWEHIFWRDSQIKILISLFQTFFWWIPVKGWIKKIEEDQELASDQGVLKHNFAGEYLASALVKVARHVKEKKLANICYLVKDENSILKRIRALVDRYPKDSFPIFGVGMIVLALVLLIICSNV